MTKDQPHWYCQTSTATIQISSVSLAIGPILCWQATITHVASDENVWRKGLGFMEVHPTVEAASIAECTVELPPFVIRMS